MLSYDECQGPDLQKLLDKIYAKLRTDSNLCQTEDRQVDLTKTQRRDLGDNGQTTMHVCKSKLS